MSVQKNYIFCVLCSYDCVCKVGTGRRPVICTSYTSHCSSSFTVTMTDTAGWKVTHMVASHSTEVMPWHICQIACLYLQLYGGQIGLLLCQVSLHFSILNTIWPHECWIFYCLSSVIENFCLLWAVMVLLVFSSTNDTSAYINLARVFAQRCLESGISEVRCDLKPHPGGKVSWKWLQKHSL